MRGSIRVKAFLRHYPPNSFRANIPPSRKKRVLDRWLLNTSLGSQNQGFAYFLSIHPLLAAPANFNSAEMFGFGGGSKSPIPEIPTTPPPAGDGSEKGNKGSNAYAFDPTGLERAAKAARELEKSTYAKQAFEITKEQERTKQVEAQAKMKEQEAAYKAYEIQRVQKEYEEKRKTSEYETQQHQQRAQYQDQLRRKQYADQLAAQKYMKEQELKKQEEMAARQEAMRKKTLEYEAELRQKTEMAKVAAETEGRIKQERMNHDLHMEELRFNAKEKRETIIESIKVASTTIGTGIQEFLGDKQKITAAVGTVTLVAFGVYAAKVTTGVTGRFIEARLGKPSLVRETSRRTPIQVLANPIPSVKRLLQLQKKDPLEGVILEPSLSSRLRVLAKATSNTKKNKAPYRNALFYGPPGTGKTLFAKSLAQHSGLEYAIMTGGDVAPLGREGVTEIHKMFDWAKTSRRGVLLFVDEADAFLQKRSNNTLSEDMRNALNAFLYRTGEASDKFMVVFASNQPELFDYAINDRIDEMVGFHLPGLREREQMLAQYFEQYILTPAKRWSRKIEVDEKVNIDKLKEVAKKTHGFSGREISKLAIAWQATAYGSDAAKLTVEMVDKVLGDHLEAHRQKREWYLLDNPDAKLEDDEPVAMHKDDVNALIHG